MIYAHAGMSPDLIDAAVTNGAKGIVVAGVGDGNMTTPALDAVKRAIAKGVVVVRSTRVGDGIVRRNIEVDDDKVGTVVSKELNPSKARVLLKLALTQTSDAKKVQEFFDTYFWSLATLTCETASAMDRRTGSATSAANARDGGDVDAVTLRQYETLSPSKSRTIWRRSRPRRPEPRRSPISMPGAATRTGSPPSRDRRFFLLGQFAITESRRTMDLPEGVGGMPKAPGIAARLAAWLSAHADMPGATFLQHVIPWTIAKFEFDADAFVHELVDSIIGDNYPVPDRMLVHNERIVREYLQWAMCGEPRPAGTFDLYAVEGGTAAMCYIFKSLKANRLLNPGDTIALATPIFTPYLEMPHLEDYDLKMVFIQARQEQRWQFSDEDLTPLLDPAVKAFFVVNPGNPYAVALSPETIARIGARAREAARPDAAHRRRLRDVRPGIPLAARGVPQEYDRRVFVQQVLRLHRLAPRRHRPARAERLRRADRRTRRRGRDGARQALRVR